MFLGRKLQISKQPSDQLDVKLESQICFEVETSGDGECWWIYNGLSLMDNCRISGSQSKCLIIWRVLNEDEGNYQCVVANELDKDTSCNAILAISSKLFSNAKLKPIVECIHVANLITALYYNITVSVRYVCALEVVDMIDSEEQMYVMTPSPKELL